MLSFAETGQVRINGGDDRTLVAEVDLDLAEVLALFEQMGGVRMPQSVHMGLLFDAAGIEREAEGALKGRSIHRFGGGGSALTVVTFGGEEQRRMLVRFPQLPQQVEGALGQGDIAVDVALAGADVQEPALRIDVRNLEAQPFAPSAGRTSK